MSGPAWNDLPTRAAKLLRGGFLQKEQQAERAIYELLDEFDAKITAIFTRYARSDDGTLQRADREKIALEIRHTCTWFAGEFETLIRESADVAAAQGIEAGRKAQLLYLKKALEQLPEDKATELAARIREIERRSAGDNDVGTT